MPSYPPGDWGNDTKTQESRDESSLSNSFFIAIGILVYLINALLAFLSNLLAFLHLSKVAGVTFYGVLLPGIWIVLGVFLGVFAVRLKPDGPGTKVVYAYLSLLVLLAAIVLFGWFNSYAVGSNMVAFFESIAYLFTYDFIIDIGIILLVFGTVRSLVRHKREQSLKH